MSIELQQVPSIRRRKEEKASLEAGTINFIAMLRKFNLLRLVRSVGLLVSANVSNLVVAVDNPKSRVSFGRE